MCCLQTGFKISSVRALRSCWFLVPSQFFVSVGSSLTNESSLTRADERALIPEIIEPKDGLERFFFYFGKVQYSG